MICCTTLVLLATLLGRRWPLGQVSAGATATVGWPIWWLWGAGLGGLAYLGTVSVLLALNWAAYTPNAIGCLVDSRLPVTAFELVAKRWWWRSGTLLLVDFTMIAVCLWVLFRHPADRALQIAPGWTWIGAGMLWLAFTELDHHAFGLYALRSSSLLVSALAHAPGLLLVAAGLAITAKPPPACASENSAVRPIR